MEKSSHSYPSHNCVFRLSAGHYLIGHKAGEPFVTIFKATEGRRIVREAYNLHQTHSSVPPPSALGPVPWVPLDPTLVLPFHQKHSRPPCTFPPPDLQQHKVTLTPNLNPQPDLQQHKVTLTPNLNP
jgi:hypothetical protein